MGGGDLNTKKSWHPSTLKNQERVWKAEQAAAEEKNRIVELQRERAQEHDKAALNELAQRNYGQADNRLHWMYDKPDKPGQHEDYLLGKEVGKIEAEHTQQNAIPALSRRVVGSSMNTTLDDTQVDLVRKMREDPLLLVKERERAARAALLNNPLQRKKLTDLLRREKEQKESKQKDSKTQKKAKKNIDSMLAAKLNALGGEKGIDLSSLLNSNDSSSDSSHDEKPKKKKKKEKSKKKSKKAKNKPSKSDTESSDDDKDTHDVHLNRYTNKIYQRKAESSHYDDRQTPEKLDDKKHIKTYKYTVSDDLHRSYGSYYDNKQSASTSKSYKDLESRKRRSYSYSDSDTKNKMSRDHLEQNRDRKRQSNSYGDSDTKKKTSRDHPAQNRDRKRRSNSYSDSDTKKKLSREHSGQHRDRKRRSNSYSDSDSKKKLSTEHSGQNRDRKRRSVSYSDSETKKVKREHSEQKRDKRHKRESPDMQKRFPSGRKEKRQGLSEAERAAKLAEMTAAGQEREVERGRRVASQRAQDAAEDAAAKGPRSANNQARELPDSLEDRIRSNRHFIQRDKMHMNQHFARR